MKQTYEIAFFGSSLVSAYWNGAATYYRGIIKYLHALGHSITFYEPDAFERQKHRDIENPSYAKSIVFSSTNFADVYLNLERASSADIIIKTSNIGVFDELLEKEVIKLKNKNNIVAFWDVDAPATLEEAAKNPEGYFRKLINQFDIILTYGGGQKVIEAYSGFGAKKCVPIYNALDPETHFPVSPAKKFESDLAFLGNRMPDREQRVFEFFFKPAEKLEGKTFLIGGNGWDCNIPRHQNIKCIGHVYTADHNAFNCTPRAVLNISRDSMARFGFSPATRVFEAAGARACIIMDKWEGLEEFLEPGTECLVAENGDEVADIISALTAERAQEIGQCAMKRILADHTYAKRAVQFQQVIENL